MTRSARIAFVGDVMLGRLVDRRQHRRPVDAVWGDVLDRLRAADATFANLECCLSTRGTPWTRTRRPFHFRADPGWAVPALRAAGVEWANLANNHVLDYEVPAFEDTLSNLDDAGVAHSGAGRDRAAARRPAIVEVGDLTVAVISFTDNTPEFAAGPDSPGTAYASIDVDDAETRDAVEESMAAARAADPDLLVASLHWGPNMVEEPPPEFRRFGRWLVDRGVDLVHGHSAHVFHGIEAHDGSPILYDTGDFVDDYAVDDDLRNDRSFAFEVSLDADTGRPRRLRLVPTEIEDCAVHLASAEAAEWSRSRMRALSAPFGTEFARDGDHLVLDLAG